MAPHNPDLPWLGLNLNAYPAYQRAMEQWVTSNSNVPVVVRLEVEGREPTHPWLWRLFLGAYLNGMEHNEPATRRANLAGYISEILDLRGLAEGSLRMLGKLEPRDIGVQIVDVSTAETLYQSANWPEDRGQKSEVRGQKSATGEALSSDHWPLTSGRDLWVESLLVPGQPWQIICRPSKEFMAANPLWQSWVVLAFGLLVTAGLGAYLGSASRRAAKVEQMVAQRTAELARANEELLTEIAERQRAEQRLAQEQFLVTTLMETIPDHIYFKDCESRFLRINRAQADLFKLPQATEAIGKTDFDFFTAEHAQRAFDDEQAILRTGQDLIGCEEKETWPDGSVTWVSTTKQAMRDAAGKITGTFGISRDITAHKRAEQALAQQARELARINQDLKEEIAIRQRIEQSLEDSEALYRSLVDTLPINVLRKDLEGRVTFGNRGYCQTMGKPIEQLRSKTDFDLFPRDLAEKYRQDDLRVMASGQVFEDIEESLSADRARRFVHVLKAPVRDAQGKIVGTQIFFWDVTARKQAEESLALKSEELTRSNRELELFAYVASHDLQEPLRMIASYTQLLKRRYQGKLDKDADEFIAYAVDGAARMQTLINDLLSYSRVGTRGKPLAPTDCNEILKRTLENLKIAIEDSHAVIHTGPLPVVQADSVQVTQLFQNLVSNALKFRGERPPEIHITAELRTNPAAGDAPEKEWVIAVKDNGIGIEKEYYDRIFIIFQRLHGREQYPGTGIGLAICKKIVERHGGRIWVESEPGQGSTFFVSFPSQTEFSI